MASLLAKKLSHLLPSSFQHSSLLPPLRLFAPQSQRLVSVAFSSSSQAPPINPHGPPNTTPAPPSNTASSLPDGLGIGGASFRSTMSFVQNILAEDDELNSRKKKHDFVHILLSRKKSFVTVTDADGNKKTGASSGGLRSEDKKASGRSSKYAAEATARRVGRAARKMGVKSVVVKVKGLVFFGKKKRAIMSWKEGFTNEGVRERCPIVAIHDVTNLPHNGCRLPKKRRI